MATITITRVATDIDANAVRGLCFEWADWQYRMFPHLRDRIMAVFEPVAYARTVADLPHIHAAPTGAMILARCDGVPAGCVMYLQQEPGLAEIKRLFVAEAGRGHGLGRALLDEMFVQMRRDGYQRVQFSSARFLTHARSLYEACGFHDIDHPAGFPEAMRDFVYFMERPL